MISRDFNILWCKIIKVVTPKKVLVVTLLKKKLKFIEILILEFFFA